MANIIARIDASPGARLLNVTIDCKGQDREN